MPRQPLELPPEIARAFVRDMHAFFAEKNQIKASEIAIRQLVALNEYLGRAREAASRRGRAAGRAGSCPACGLS
jgi:hypothetical protein